MAGRCLQIICMQIKSTAQRLEARWMLVQRACSTFLQAPLLKLLIGEVLKDKLASGIEGALTLQKGRHYPLEMGV